MKKSEFLLEVKAELDNIKLNATKEEISRLNIKYFRHYERSNCIYGQMTGQCDSMRANELSPKVYDRVIPIPIRGYYIPFRRQDMSTERLNFTALEKYLYMVKRPTHKKIISYLRGETDTIKLV